MKIRFQIALLLLVLVSFSANAQDYPYHYFNHISPSVVNPALVANEHEVNVVAGTYNLWAGGFSPVNNNLLSVSFSPGAKNGLSHSNYGTRVGLGLHFFNEKEGAFQQNMLHLVYSYQIPLTRETKLLLGVAAIAENLNINVNELIALNPDDPRLMTGSNNAFAFDGSFGIGLRGEAYLISFSVLNLASSNFVFDDPSVKEVENFRKLYLSANYRLQLRPKINVIPEIMLRNSMYSNYAYDASCTFALTHLSVGLGYREEQSVFIYARIPFKGFEFSYTSENPLASNHLIGSGHTFSLSWGILRNP